ncbi:TetR/AcrR family transcriptional regulator [Corynebacterium sp. 153RC1]|uniref:TetR/AcrR family transcriptional regulator n=1 Tax=unclassified Corynebacterium TaxID=2624378 RepID=UPI00211C989A|nr:MULTISPECIES: TetR/AcrR family transcriptional regulator [unclassified Corynebacterium]MCQ9352618.1 TetR/AcrR family transcriptional regulator [Corynebacterium sp. 209RC1]MCQ9354802.1 TetR/AcrR family transcriptional regulator [Corynebacterium sp. 1222RC1]MCQ9356987.1 TetR/AcrR family transcriptional regulator [Corynebacterium sp. 122RC1]MCQ9359070.1 TetR/AcrR family transcriptional regulator [Corynebacterium sp. 142RC1]MCQ9361455.1 TetR/AcrR family transcriptional regulator [Corynebacteriu
MDNPPEEDPVIPEMTAVDTVETTRALLLTSNIPDFTIDHAASKYQCSKSTIYSLGNTKNEIVYRVLVSFFKELTQRTHLALGGNKPVPAKLQDYFRAINSALQPASPAFMQDLIATEVGKKVYDHNTKAAIETIRNLLEEGVIRGEFQAVDTHLIAAFVGHTMEHIQQGDYLHLASVTEAYAALDTLIRNGLSTPPAP